MFGSSLHPVTWRRAHGLFTLFVFVSVYWCPTHIVLCFCFACLRLVYPMLPISLDCPFFIVPSVFSNVYLQLPKGCQTLKPHIHPGSHENQLFRPIFINTSGVMVSVFALVPKIVSSSPGRINQRLYKIVFIVPPLSALPIFFLYRTNSKC